jgi:FkbH-like protein
VELIARTTQFNATGRCFSAEELRRIVDAESGRVFVLRMRDRLADHGLVGVAVVLAGEIMNFVLSCRVIGLNGERALLSAVVEDPGNQMLTGRIVQTDRNMPVRNLYAAHGFQAAQDGCWQACAPAAPALTDVAHA